MQYRVEAGGTVVAELEERGGQADLPQRAWNALAAVRAAAPTLVRGVVVAAIVLFPLYLLAAGGGWAGKLAALCTVTAVSVGVAAFARDEPDAAP